MVNGNYIIYGDRPASESKYVADHVQTQTAEHKPKRKYSKATNELQSSLNKTHQLDNETDSIKYEKTKEPRLLRYVPTTDVEEHFIAEKFETYDMKPDLEERPRRYAFTKKTRNPADGSVNYGYSRSSSSSPNANLPTITEYTEPFSSYKDRTKDDTLEEFESRFDKFFARPVEKNGKYDGTHPDSLYRVAGGANAGDSRTVRVAKALRWPAALITVCAALAVFVYFLMPSKINAHDNVNSTLWESSAVRYDTSAHPKPKVFTTNTKTYTTEADDFSSESFTDTTNAFNPTSTEQPTSTPKKETTKKPVEIDFYNPEQLSDIISIIDSITGGSGTIQPVLAPVYPDHITPEVQYGDKDKGRIPKLFDNKNKLSEDSTIMPHITQKPEKPLAIFLNSEEIPETLNRAETAEAKPNTNRQKKTSSSEEVERLLPLEDLLALEPEIRDSAQEFVGAVQKFTSGHSNVFGVGIEDLDIMKSTTQSSNYNTRVSPTLPTWYTRDTTTKNYPTNSSEDTHCRSPRLKMCRGFLPYDLAGPPIKIKGVSAEHALSSFLMNNNCSSRLRQFVCAIVEPECQPVPLPPKKPCRSFCKSLPNCYPAFPRLMFPYVNCDEYEVTNCFAPTAPCYIDELPCGDGTCVSKHALCDGVSDCPNGRDEEGCKSCPETQYRCPSSGECIKKLWLCDGILDCPDGEDEVSYVCAKEHHPLIQAPGPPTRGEFPNKDGKDEVEALEEAQAAESAPASAVTRYGVVNGRRDQRADDSSKELLETSDSTNGLRRNFTGRSYTNRGSKNNTLITRTLPPIPLDEYSQESTPEPKRRKQPRKKIQNRYRPTEPSGPFDSSEGGEEMGGPARERPKPRVQKVFRTDSNKTTNAYERHVDNRAVMEALQTELDNDRRMRMKSMPDEMVVEKEDSVTEGKPLGGLSSPCPVGELRCVDGRCITLAMLCDGNIDCSDHADEDNCFT